MVAVPETPAPAKGDLRAGTAPCVSIVIAAYNCAEFLPQTLQSIREQTFKDWECVIVDDGSTDKTLEIARGTGDPRIRAVTQANGGPSAARNCGLGYIHPGSTYLTFMDSDDLWMPDTLEVLVNEAESHREAVAVHGVGQCIDRDGNPHEDANYQGGGRFICDALGRKVLLPPAAPTSFQSLWFSNPFPPGLVLGRRAAYEQTGCFDTAPCLEDWDILLRLSRRGDLHFVNRVVLSYRRHEGNISAVSATQNMEKMRFLAHKTFFSGENDPRQRKIVRRNWRSTQLHYLRQGLVAAKMHCGRQEYRKSAAALLRALVGLCRLVRGYPTLRGI